MELNNVISHREKIDHLKICIPYGKIPIIIKLIRFFFFLFSIFLIISFQSCNDPVKTALKTTNPSKAKKAVNQLNDQTTIKTIALEAKGFAARAYATEKLADQNLLKEIALENDDWRIRNAAIKNIHFIDQSLLAKSVVEDDYWVVRKTAFNKFSKLAKSDSFVSNDVQYLNFRKYIEAFENVPKDHYERLVYNILPVLQVLSDTNVINIVGEITSISIFWTPTSQLYKYDISKVIEEVEGESIECSIKLKNINRSLSHSWTTNFPDSKTTKYSSLGFEEAEIDAGAILDIVFEKLSPDLLVKIIQSEFDDDFDKNISLAAIAKLSNQSLLGKIALENNNDYRLRQAAVNKLTDMPLIVKIALQDESSFVREVAIEKITDQHLVNKIALDGKNYRDRIAAIKKLNNQSALAKIAAGTDYFLIRLSAIERLTDEPLLAKIAFEDEDFKAREFAILNENLTNQLAFAKIAVEDEHFMVRKAAIKRLNNQTLLKKIIIEDNNLEVRLAAQERLKHLHQ